MLHEISASIFQIASVAILEGLKSQTYTEEHSPRNPLDNALYSYRVTSVVEAVCATRCFRYKQGLV